MNKLLEIAFFTRYLAIHTKDKNQQIDDINKFVQKKTDKFKLTFGRIYTTTAWNNLLG